jgi:hypothetical protein
MTAMPETDLIDRLENTYTAWNNPPSEFLPDGAGVLLEAAAALSEKDRRIAELEALIDGEGCPDADRIGALFSRAEKAEAENVTLRARLASCEAAAGQAAYSMISDKYGRDMAERVASTGWQWPDDAPNFIDTTIYRLCAALKETSHADR